MQSIARKTRTILPLHAAIASAAVFNDRSRPRNSLQHRHPVPARITLLQPQMSDLHPRNSASSRQIQPDVEPRIWVRARAQSLCVCSASTLSKPSRFPQPSGPNSEHLPQANSYHFKVLHRWNIMCRANRCHSCLIHMSFEMCCFEELGLTTCREAAEAPGPKSV